MRVAAFRPAHRAPALAGVVLLTAAVAGCAPTDSGTTSASPAAPPSASASCAPADLATKTAGSFTVGTDSPAYEPWFSDNDPTNGKGYESAVAYAVAEKLGYTQDQVKWVTASFNSVIQPGKNKKFDVDINQFSITDKRKKAVDFSTGYYDVTQAVVTNGKSKAGSVTTLAGLKDLKLGAQVGTTSYDAIQDVVKPTRTAAVFDTNDAAKLALANGQVDAIVVDLPTALYLAAAEIKGGKVVGQLPATPGAGTTEQFGMVLAKGSPLTTCVSGAVDALKSDGTLTKLQEQWLTEGAGLPFLK